MLAMPFPIRSFAVAAFASLAVGGCATMSESPVQQLEVRAVLDYREIGGVGCILSNDVGRWYMIAPGRVTVTRSSHPISISCKKGSAATAAEVVQARLDTSNLMGNLVISAGLGYFVDRHSGAGYGYPAILTVVMQPSAPPPEAAGANPLDTRVF
jgi:hypothetical protein